MMKMQSKLISCVAVLVVLVLLCSFGVNAVEASYMEQCSFSLDMQLSVNADDSDVLDLVISVKDVSCELDAIEFVLNFDKNKVAGVVTTPGSAMDTFITAAPMYNLLVSGVEVPVSRYEQICTFNGNKGMYMCRFLDKLTYPGEKPGQSYHGLIQDGDLVITIPFYLLEDVSSEETITFSVTNVKGTTRGTLKSVNGRDASVVINGSGQSHIHSWTGATCSSPKICTECGATEGAKGSHQDANGDGLCDHCKWDVSYDELEPESPETGDVDNFSAKAVLLIAIVGLAIMVQLSAVKQKIA